MTTSHYGSSKELPSEELPGGGVSRLCKRLCGDSEEVVQQVIFQTRHSIYYTPCYELRIGWYWMALDGIAWHWMVLDGIGWYCMALDGIGWHWMVFDGTGWYWMVLDGIGWYYMGLDGIKWYWMVIPTTSTTHYPLPLPTK